jgi:hypothetical protein
LHPLLLFVVQLPSCIRHPAAQSRPLHPHRSFWQKPKGSAFVAL